MQTYMDVAAYPLYSQAAQTAIYQPVQQPANMNVIGVFNVQPTQTSSLTAFRPVAAPQYPQFTSIVNRLFSDRRQIFSPIAVRLPLHQQPQYQPVAAPVVYSQSAGTSFVLRPDHQTLTTQINSQQRFGVQHRQQYHRDQNQTVTLQAARSRRAANHHQLDAAINRAQMNMVGMPPPRMPALLPDLSTRAVRLNNEPPPIANEQDNNTRNQAQLQAVAVLAPPREREHVDFTVHGIRQAFNEWSKSLSCPVCRKQYSKRSNLKQHLKIHTGDKRFECNWCFKRFQQKHTLQDHERIHTGEKPFHCRECGKQFRVKHNLTTHIRLHTGRKPYRCPHAHCDSAYSSKSGLNSHIKNIHPGEH